MRREIKITVRDREDIWTFDHDSLTWSYRRLLSGSEDAAEDGMSNHQMITEVAMRILNITPIDAR